MKYYSDITEKIYSTEDELVKAELEYTKVLAEKEEVEKKAREEANAKKAEHDRRYQEVEDARKTMMEAQSNYRKVMAAYVADYHTYRYSAPKGPSLFDVLFGE